MLLDRETTFAVFDFGLDRRLVKAVARMGFVYPTLVQSKAIPLALEGKDLLVRARTGSGKTAAFSLPLLHKILVKKQAAPRSKPGVLAVVLVPTKELCDQTYRALQELTYYCRDIITVQALMGDNMRAQQALLRDLPEVLVATPARLLAHLKADNLKLKDSVETLVIDEADLVLSFGYDEDVRAVVSCLPRIYQGLLMSATLSPELDDLKRVVLHSPAVLKLEEGRSDGQLLQFYAVLPEDDKYLLVYVFLKLGVLEGKGLFFVNSIDACYRLKLFLEQFHIRSAVLNAELPLNSRLHTLQEFNRGIFDYLIATDESMDACKGDDDDSDDSDEDMEEEEDEEEEEEEEGEDMEEDDEEEGDEEEKEQTDGTKAKRDDGKKKKAVQQQQSQRKDAEYGVSRGVDFKAVSFVVNVDFPPSTRSYTHRVGRTARGGANGTALSLVGQGSEKEMAVLAEVQASQPALPPMEGDPMLAAAEANGAASSSHLRAQPAPLAFDLKELDGFRYRVQDVKRSVTKLCVKEARLAEIKQELMNSETLRTHFESNPQEFQILRHDKGILPSNRIREHLKHLPDYLLPKGMRVGADPSAKKRKKRRGGKKRALGQGTDRSRRKDKDPLQSFEQAEDQAMDDGAGGGAASDDDDDDDVDPLDEGDAGAAGDRVYHEGEQLGRSTAGRQRWKQAHKKGKFSTKPKREKKKMRRL